MIVPIEDLRNDRDAIIGIVSEWYLYPKVRDAKIMPKKKMPIQFLLRRIIHGAWTFWYDEKRNVIYL